MRLSYFLNILFNTDVHIIDVFLVIWFYPILLPEKVWDRIWYHLKPRNHRRHFPLSWLLQHPQAILRNHFLLPSPARHRRLHRRGAFFILPSPCTEIQGKLRYTLRQKSIKRIMYLIVPSSSLPLTTKVSVILIVSLYWQWSYYGAFPSWFMNSPAALWRKVNLNCVLSKYAITVLPSDSTGSEHKFRGNAWRAMCIFLSPFHFYSFLFLTLELSG